MRTEGTNASQATPTGAAERSRDPKKVHDAARQFESLLIGQMLKSMRTSANSWLGSDGDSASESTVEMAEDAFAKALASTGGLGLARLVESGLNAARTAPHVGPSAAPTNQKLNE
jgi:flagellar protein FlgJ